jgi:hypothetical protein
MRQMHPPFLRVNFRAHGAATPNEQKLRKFEASPDSSMGGARPRMGMFGKPVGEIALRAALTCGRDKRAYALDVVLHHPASATFADRAIAILRPLSLRIVVRSRYFAA